MISITFLKSISKYLDLKILCKIINFKVTIKKNTLQKFLKPKFDLIKLQNFQYTFQIYYSLFLIFIY
jgi:hypothetical protein